MTCQSPRDTLTGMWGNLVYHIWESQWSAHKSSTGKGAFDYSHGQVRVSAYILIEKPVDLI